MIHGFYGEYKWLSNFEPIEIWSDGYNFPSTENAYQASKCVLVKEMKSFIDITPGQAQRLGQKIEKVSYWEHTKWDIMYRVVKQKFQDERLKKLLLATGPHELIEGNWWHDNYWGVCTCHECKDIHKQNNLGKIIMLIRHELQIKQRIEISKLPK